MRILTLVFLLIAGLARAEPYPEYISPYVNDFAGVLGFRGEAEVAERLETLRTDTGVEFTVVTIKTRNDFDSAASFQAFATRLFNGWGIGDAERNDGIMLLVATEDRDVRLELGRGYASGWDRAAQAVIDQNILPKFRDGDMRGGIIEGAAATIDRIALPFVAGEDPPARASSGSGGSGEGGVIGWIVGAVLGLGVLFLILRRKIGDAVVGMKKCPNCGTRHLTRDRETLKAATREETGQREERVWCSNCDYDDRQRFTIPIIRSSTSSSSSSGSFGGGSSSGGGASGKW